MRGYSRSVTMSCIEHDSDLCFGKKLVSLIILIFFHAWKGGVYRTYTPTSGKDLIPKYEKPTMLCRVELSPKSWGVRMAFVAKCRQNEACTNSSNGFTAFPGLFSIKSIYNLLKLMKHWARNGWILLLTGKNAHCHYSIPVQASMLYWPKKNADAVHCQ